MRHRKATAKLLLATFMPDVAGADWAATFRNVQADNCEGFPDWKLDSVAMLWLHLSQSPVPYKMVLQQDELIIPSFVLMREHSLLSRHKAILQFSRTYLQPSSPLA